MKVRRDSWHYKVWKYRHSGAIAQGYNISYLEERMNLCNYFWTIVLIAPIFFVARAAERSFIALWGIKRITDKWPTLIQPVFMSVMAWAALAMMPYWLPGNVEVIAVLYYTFLLLSGFASAVILTMAMKEYFRSNPTGTKELAGDFAEVVAEFLIAKKKRVCPKIEVE